jgi:hypothetical protein
MIKGNIFKNWNKTCYISNLISTTVDEYGNEINEYSTPIKYKMNIQPTKTNSNLSSSYELHMYGATIDKAYKALVSYDFKDKVKEGDIAYLDGATPEGETVNGENANYIVQSVRPQNLATAIYFSKLEK